MVTLNEYKNKLVNTYNWPIDNNETEKAKRKELLDKRYPDEYLERIIADTNNFAIDLLSSDMINYMYYKEEIEDDTTTYIRLNLHGGWASDVLFIDDKGRIISQNILRQLLGNSIKIEIIYEEIEDNTNDDILSCYYRYYIYITGFSAKIDEIKDKILMNEKSLIKKK